MKLFRSGASLSGKERNHFFLSQGGKAFHDISSVAGLDDIRDGRSFVLFDFDRDGWQDIVIINANEPKLVLYHNRIGEITGSRNRVVALRFVGAHRDADPVRGKSNRDGVGAFVTVTLGDTQVVREQRAGEGLGGQNSATLLVGIGERSGADAVTIRWPSGTLQELGPVAAGQLLTVYEDPSQGPGGQAFAAEPYVRPEVAAAFALRPPTPLPSATVPVRAAAQNGTPRLALYSTMATWCTSCLGEIPHWEHLTSLFAPEDLQIYAVPVEVEDTQEMLSDYVKRYQPAYTMLDKLSAPDVQRVEDFVVEELGRSGLPASFLTDPSGRLIKAMWGAPSVSDIRRILEHLNGTRG